MTHHNAVRGPWLTPGIIDRLMELHVATAGLSMKDIAEILRREYLNEITRNAVIGKTRRLNLALRQPGVMPWGKKREAKPAEPKPRKRRPKSRPAPPPPPQLIEINAPPPEGLTILQLCDGVCHWPLGEVMVRPPYFYCGQATELGCSYCGEHYAVAHTVTRERYR